jgi:predicted RNA-binding Zn ribbon-like protein
MDDCGSKAKAKRYYQKKTRKGEEPQERSQELESRS